MSDSPVLTCLVGFAIGLISLTGLVMFVTWVAYGTVEMIRARDARLDATPRHECP